MGVKVDRSDKGWEVAVVDVDLTPKGKELFGLEKLVSCVRLHSGTCTDLTPAHPPNAP